MGTATTDANGVATLTGVSLSGLNAGTYSNAVSVRFSGDPTYAASSGSGTLVVNPAQPRPQSPPVITGKQTLFSRKTNKKGKPIGKPVLSGFLFDFSEPLDPSSATNNANYQVDTITTKRVKKQTRRILHQLTSFSVSYSAANDSVTLTFAGKPELQDGRPNQRGRWTADRRYWRLGRRLGRKQGVHDLTTWQEYRRSVNPTQPRRISGSPTGTGRRIES